MTKINIFPLVDYPSELFPIVEMNYDEKTFNEHREYAYRIGNKLYCFGQEIDIFNSSKQRIAFQTENMERQKIFSLLLRRLILYGIAESIEKSKFFIPNNIKNSSRILIQKTIPSLENDYIQVFERLELQCVHWQDVNFGIIVNYRTKNDWSSNFENEVGVHCSYQNIRKYVPKRIADDLMLFKIPELRFERSHRRWRGDALKQKFEKIKTLFKDSLNWEETNSTIEINLPTNQLFKISDEFSDIIHLG